MSLNTHITNAEASKFWREVYVKAMEHKAVDDQTAVSVGDHCECAADVALDHYANRFGDETLRRELDVNKGMREGK